MNHKNKGQGLMEYIILLALISISSIAVLRVLGRSINVRLAQITDAVQGEKSVRSVNLSPVNSKYLKKKDLSDFFKGASSEDKQAN